MASTLKRKGYFVLLFILAAGLAVAGPSEAAAPDDSNAKRYLAAVQQFADNVLAHCRDTYGPEKTPLFVDGLNIDTREPVKWRFDGQTWIISNFASQQNLLRTLDGLSKLGGDKKYRQAAIDTTRYAMENLSTPIGLLYWGGHCAWGLDKHKPLYSACHELKQHYPYFEFMYEVDPAFTKKLMERIWAQHIVDWSTLEFDRHANLTKPEKLQWDHKYAHDKKVPFEGSRPSGWAFANMGQSLIYTGVMLGQLTDDDRPATWAKRLAGRFHAAADPNTGLGYVQFTYHKKIDPAQKQFGKKFGKKITHYTLTKPLHSRQTWFQLCLLQTGEMLGESGRDLIEAASDELVAYVKYAYDAKTNTFATILTDGTKLSYDEMYGGGYYEKKKMFKPKPASGQIVWIYGTAYRLTGKADHWKFLRRVCRANGLGDIGDPKGKARKILFETKDSDPYMIFGLLELHRITKDRAFLRLAGRVADNVLKERFQKGFFVAGRDHFYASVNAIEPVALLHLIAAIKGKLDLMPTAWPDRGYFHCRYDGIKTADWDRSYDFIVFYGRKRTDK